jgi:capsular exopolysaccharide synthesis family protein
MQTLLFASQFDGDGKTLCALKCARTMVKQGYRTLLIDADFRVPGLSRQYSEQRRGRHGLSAYLAEEAEAAEVLFETGLPGLWFLPTGEEGEDDGELLASPAFRKLLEVVEPLFDRLIIDISSIRESDDVQAVTRHLGATYLVVQNGRGKYRDLKDAALTLQSAGANLAGFIWNEGTTRRRRKDHGPAIEPIAYPVAEASLSRENGERAAS